MTSSRLERLAAYRSVQRRYRPSHREFELLVLEALEGLPEQFRALVDNVALVVENWPPHKSPVPGESDAADDLLGLYEGTPFGERGVGYHLVTPDRITIYRGPILAACKTRAEVVREVRDTVSHEIGHYFGLGDDELA
jgi:predicted Zn-dependent protease with MMP-like domain